MSNVVKKILHIIVGLNVGGAELMLKRLVMQGKQDNLFSHEIVSLTDLGLVGKNLRDAGIKVYTLNMHSFASMPIGILRLRRVIKQVNPDVVQTWMYHADFLGGIAAKSLGVKKILWSIRTTDAKEGNSKITPLLQKICARLSYTIPTKIISAAVVSRDSHVKIGYDESKMIVIPNGYDLSVLEISENERIRMRSDLGMSDNEIVIGSVGRFNEAKNPKIFVELAAEVIKTYPNLKFMMVGKNNTWENHELVSWIKFFNLTQNFILLGQQSNIATYIKTMDLFCLHSKTEGFPNVLAEAMYIGIPCVTVDVGDAKKIAADLVPVIAQNDFDALVSAIKLSVENIINNKYSLKKAVLEYKRHIIENFSIENIYNVYKKIWLDETI